MNLVKGKKIENPKNSYRFVLDFMHGDADADTTEEVIIHEGSKLLLPFVEYVMSLRDGRNNKSFDFDYSTLDEEEECFEFFYPNDATAYGDHKASFEECTITYYDENGIEYEVKVKE